MNAFKMLLLLLCAACAHAQPAAPPPATQTPADAPAPAARKSLLDALPKPEDVPHWDRPRAQHFLDFDWFKAKGYATTYYSNYDWRTFRDKRDEVDLERLSLGFDLLFTSWLEFDVEVEFEHGGTGSSLEFERFEEFGEFEFEAEKGGEVEIEELELEFFIHAAFNINVGHLVVPVGYTNRHHLPSDYFAVTRPQSETNLIPAVWHANAIQFYGQFLRYFEYDVMLLASLDSSRYSSERFAADASEDVFESELAQDLGVAARLGFKPLGGIEVSISVFFGNTGNNRPRDDLNTDAYLLIANGYALFDRRPVTARASVVYANLQNSEKVTLANKNLPNTLQLPRTPVAREALGFFVEAGFDFLWLMKQAPAAQSLELFLRYDWYDTQYNTVRSVIDNDRFERQAFTTGLNCRPYPNVIIKTSFEWRWLHLEKDNDEITYSLGLGVEF